MCKCFHSAPSDKLTGAGNTACWERCHSHVAAQSVHPLALSHEPKAGEGGRVQKGISKTLIQIKSSTLGIYCFTGSSKAFSVSPAPI